MAQQIKKKFIGNDQIDSTKLKLLQNQAVRVVDSAGTEQELIKLGSSDEVLVKGQEVGLKSEIEAEESRAMTEEASIRALITSNSGDQTALIEQEASRAQAIEASLQSQISQEISDRQSAVYSEANLREQADSLLEASIDAEESRAMSVESSLQSQISQEILDRQADVDAEESRAMAVESSLQSQISQEISDRQASVSAEQSSRIAADQDLSDRLDALEVDPTTKGYVDSEVSDLQSQIDNILSNVDPAALDSLTEVVEAFQNADSDLNAAIQALGTGSTSALVEEISRAQAAEQTLQSQIDAEESRAMSAESSLQSQITQEISDRQADVNAEESRAMSVESSLQSQITQEISDRQADVDAEESRALAAEAILESDLSNLDGYAQDIRSDLDDEISRALAVESSLQSQLSQEISNREADINSEESRAMAVESSLQSQISQEISSRQSALSAEESARISADSLLSDRIDPIEDLLDFEKLSVYENNVQVYADAKAPEADVSLRDGWYFKNTQAGEKINWYFFDGINQANISLGDFSAFAVMTFDSVSPVRSPILAAYTMPTGVDDVMPGFAHSRVVYSGLSATPVAGKKYLVYFGENPAIHPELPRLQLSKSTQSSLGQQNPSERVLTSSFGSNSSDLVNTTQFMVQSIGVNSPSFKDEVELRIRPASLVELQAEESRAMAVESSLQSQIDAEVSARLALESSLNSNVSGSVEAEESRAMAAEASLQSQINNVLSNVDPAALDSLTEIVSAFQDADSDLNYAISTLAQNSTDAISEEQSRAMGVESGLDSRLTTAEADIDSLETNKANKSLSNLDAVTAIPASVTDLQSENTAQSFATEFKINTKSQTTSVSGNIRVISGDASGEFSSGGGRLGSGANLNASMLAPTTPATGLVSMVSGAIFAGTQGSTGVATVSSGSIVAAGITGNSGQSSLLSGIIVPGSTGTTGKVQARSGINYDNGASGPVEIESGFTAGLGRSGRAILGSGKSGEAVSGDVLIFSGEIGDSLGWDNTGNNSDTGEVRIRTGFTNGSGTTGSAILSSGDNYGTGNSGDVSILSGSVSSGVRGKVSISSRIVEIESMLDMQSNKIVDLADPTDSQDAATKAYVDSRRPIFNKQSFVVGSNDVGTSHVDLSHEADSMSLVVFVGRLALHKDEDYTVSVVDGVTRISWTGSFGFGGDEEVANGDKIFVTYSR